jgi:hypothetical protein
VGSSEVRFALLVLLALAAGGHALEPRGLRNKNPGNIVAPASGRIDWWPGAVGVDDEGYLIFERKIDGIRAIVINLKSYHRKHKINTVRKIINRWTRVSSSDDDRRGYILTVSRRLGVGPDTPLNMYDPRVLREITRGIVYYENGVDPYSRELYARVFP